MKKAILIILFAISSKSLKCDVVYIPHPISSYSTVLIVSLENYINAKNTTNYWGGLGIVGSLFYQYDLPLFGLETAIERRHYFKSDQFRHFFISAFLGGGCMTDFKYFSGIGLVPGFKINYKANLTANLVLEPYISLSVPITHELRKDPETIVFPALTFGVRVGFNKLNDRRSKT